jgi:hypothetical protein
MIMALGITLLEEALSQVEEKTQAQFPEIVSQVSGYVRCVMGYHKQGMITCR